MAKGFTLKLYICLIINTFKLFVGQHQDKANKREITHA